MRSFDRDLGAMTGLAAKLRSAGPFQPEVVAAFARIPRRMFVPAPYQADTYQDRALPIECGQTLSAPSTVATMLTALEVRPADTVLEVGCGSGFQAAILALLAAKVITLDRFRTLVDLTEDRLTALKIANVTPMVADGFDGFSRQAPYHRIVIDGAVAKIPPALMDQLADKGILVAPVGSGPSQTLVRIIRDGRLFHRTDVGQVRFIPLIEGVASRL
jgi:protein-L-isoaspartate(D-aspartate) O-methyltransferase